MTLSILLSLSFFNIRPNCNGSIVVFNKLKLILFDLTPKVPIEATFLLLNFQINKVLLLNNFLSFYDNLDDLEINL